MNDKKSYYAIIPASVRYDKFLSANAKLLYGEITALCNEKGFCWATNNYFAQLYEVSEHTISGWIKQLIKAEHIKSEINKSQGNTRTLWILPTKISIPIDEKIHTPIDENVIHNNTSINNTNNKEEFLGEIRTDFTSYMTSWNDFARKNRLVAVARITDKRRKKLESRFKEPMFDFERILNIASEQKFLLGENERKWKVEFDWLIENDNNYVKVLEKKYLKSTSTYQSTIPKEQNKWM